MTALDVLVFYVPVSDTEEVLQALFDVGAGRVGNYDSCAFVSEGRGQFRPLEGAEPALGQINEVEHVKESRVEITFTRDLRATVVDALRAVHPFEEPSFHVVMNVAND